jgi:hypothetical protein
MIDISIYNMSDLYVFSLSEYHILTKLIYLTLKKEAAWSSEKFVSYNISTQMDLCF